MHLVPVCRLSVERIREELFTGGFRPMKEKDYYAYCDAGDGALIADIAIGRFHYDVIFTPELGSVQIFDYNSDEPSVWEMDLQSGKTIEL